MTPVALIGPTASGKSQLAMAVARARPDVEIVTIDAMQVYRGMDIGTAKPTRAEQAEVQHHLIDVASPSEDYGLARWQHDARATLADIERRGARALLVGGTGLYLRALVDDLDIPGQFPGTRAELDAEDDTYALFDRLRALDPLAASRMEPTNRRRVVRALEVTLGSGRPFSSYGPGLDSYGATAKVHQVGLRLPRPVLDERIDVRYDAQMTAGFLAEVQRLFAAPGGFSQGAGQALGYKEIAAHLRGECTLDDALTLARQRTRKFARRQERWFRRDPRVVWFDSTGNSLQVLDQLLGEWDRCF
ncbi:MAG: tRNA (adenosine(37)-N6)-dimethylallyltransferase MiaA [Actinobacteria bacterium]|uniref:tRNA dimethylallyltransferase n=1 Tax=freshwater metagenome TaxID=449393 RepID=A0A6J6SQF7_9ZZZZ|nr:tRNA (adenosine(37)-N6)-dimethylallyltransferase MiaA [Actinomycetota bacterium]MSX88695.1 tRNA (adenosine(37)-N6)-dimethylallyltransferase MiaA [Actinomycetota bacterium]MSY71246.1 tRNA (adenosine(37)-N6)-dimethylallyltransferase MiaA [Actinomycetota bacterium]